jgi:hypothetical protein
MIGRNRNKSAMLGNCGIVKLWNCGIVELWNCGIVELSNCGIIMVLWDHKRIIMLCWYDNENDYKLK